MKIKLNKDQKLWFTSDTHYDHKNICAATTNWVGAENLNQLETIIVSGSMVSIAEKPLTEDNLDAALGICIKAAQAHRNALAKLINDSY